VAITCWRKRSSPADGRCWRCGARIATYARFDEQAFIARHGVNFPNLITDESNAAALYEQATGEAWIGTPTFLIFSPDGKLAAKQVGGVTQKLIEDFIAGAKR
jgi:hypothetical protein